LAKHETPKQSRLRKNKAISIITKRQEVLENIMLAETGKGKDGSGRTPKAMKALKEFEMLDQRISFIQFRT